MSEATAIKRDDSAVERLIEERNKYMDMCCLYEYQLTQCLKLLNLHGIGFPACLKEGGRANAQQNY